MRKKKDEETGENIQRKGQDENLHKSSCPMTFSSKCRFWVKQNIMEKIGLCRNGEHCILKPNRNAFGGMG